MFQFADCNIKVFKERGVTERKKGSGGNNKTPSRTVQRIKRVNKRKREIDRNKKLSKRFDSVHHKEVPDAH